MLFNASPHSIVHNYLSISHVLSDFRVSFLTEILFLFPDCFCYKQLVSVIVFPGLMEMTLVYSQVVFYLPVSVQATKTMQKNTDHTPIQYKTELSELPI